MRYIASCSFGKDSLAMILTIIEHGLPLDEVVYCEVMFDENISGEYPEHADFIHNKAIPILEQRYGLKVRVIKADTTYKEQFYRIRTKGRSIGTLTGFPTLWSPWCNGYLKRNPIKAYHKEQTEPIHEYVGIAADEVERLERLLQKPNTSAPLADFNITEKQAIEMCKEVGLLSPIYEKQSRNGCWFCHNARIGEMRQLYIGIRIYGRSSDNYKLTLGTALQSVTAFLIWKSALSERRKVRNDEPKGTEGSATQGCADA